MTLQPLKAAKPLKTTKLTPNLIVSSVERSLAFYTEVLGFARGITVPEESPLVFAAVTSGSVEIFLNDRSAVAKESPQFAGLSIGGSGNTMFIEVEDVDPLHERLKPSVSVSSLWLTSLCSRANSVS